MPASVKWNSMRRPEFQIARRFSMSIWTIVLIILVIALLGGFSGIGGGPFYGTGYYGGGGLGLVIIILLVLLLMGRL
jgi:putative copper export protein